MITETIKADITEAMKAREALTLEVLRGVKAAFTNELVAKGMKPTDELPEADALAVLKRLAKQRKEAADQFENGGRPELAQKEKEELTIIEKYLPQMASKEEILKVAEAKVAELGADKSKAGMMIGVIMKELGGNADGNDVREVLADLLK